LDSSNAPQRPTIQSRAAVTDASSQSVGGILQMREEAMLLPPIGQRKRVVLVRHGESTWNAIGRIQGSSDFAVLTTKGETQAETSRQMLLSDNFDGCFYSPLARAKRTAEIIWNARKDPMVPIHDLREIDLYSFQGLMKNEGKALYGEAYKTWQKDPANFQIDGHYPVRELWERALSCWSDILNSEGTSILVVAHNAVNQALVATATGLGPEYFRQLLQSNCGVSVLDFTPQRIANGPPYVCLDRLNQAHFQSCSIPPKKKSYHLFVLLSNWVLLIGQWGRHVPTSQTSNFIYQHGFLLIQSHETTTLIQCLPT